MQKRPIWASSIVLVIVGLVSSSAHAQQGQTDTPYKGSPLFWDVESIIEHSVQHMSRVYELDDKQEMYTRELMTKEVKGFLKDYEKDLRWLIFEIWDYQLKGEMPPVEIVKEWGRRGEPLLEAIKKEIFSGNMRWRNILTEEQRRIHDRDLENLTKQFEDMNQRVERWSKGIIDESDLLGQVSNGARRFRVRDSEDAWSYYVRKFIIDYGLDEGQRKAAYSVLNELKKEARAYRQAHDTEFKQLEAKEQELRDLPPAENPSQKAEIAEKWEELRKERRRLEEPISGDMFSRLKRDLDKIPTVDQKRTREQLVARLNHLADRPVTTHPAAPTTEPAATTMPAEDASASADP